LGAPAGGAPGSGAESSSGRLAGARGEGYQKAPRPARQSTRPVLAGNRRRA